ncbi:MAG TPA: gamma carbonic anhydrase family protein [Rubrivivax sp.]
MAVYRLDDEVPQVGANAWVADNATVIGRVTLGADVSIWYGTVVRGDTDGITIGRGSNVQESSVLHADPGFPLTIGDDVTVGHQVMLHGCSVGDGSLIGIGAVVLNGARIGKHCLVGAGALVTEGKVFPDGSLIVGAPAAVKRALTTEQIEGLLRTAQHYVDNARRHRNGLVRVD